MSEYQKDKYELNDLLAIMAKLRDPETGCPWDRRQNFRTIAPNTIEEAYEVVDAIAQNDMAELRLELGDLLLQVVFHSQMAKEQELFDFEGVVQGLCEKLLRRHPHVFGAADISSEAELNANWEAIKQREQIAKGNQSEKSLLADVTLGLPALTRAVKLQKKAKRVGFDWDFAEEVMAKINEEVAEVVVELEKEPRDKAKLTEEIGDLLFAVANLSRKLHIDPEQAARQANEKFIRRFQYIEQQFSDRQQLTDASTEELESMWETAKSQGL